MKSIRIHFPLLNEKKRSIPSVPSGMRSDESGRPDLQSLTESQEKRGLQGTSIVIEFLYLDLSVCNRCRGTDRVLEEAVLEVGGILDAAGLKTVIRKIHVQTEEEARRLGFRTSPTIRINGKELQLEAKESLCESCGDLCGEDVDCRVWSYQGKEYTVPPREMIIDAVIKEAYGRSERASVPVSPEEDLRENLKRFFRAKGRKETTR